MTPFWFEPFFDDLYILDGGATLMFAIDSTGSMGDDIVTAKNIVTDILNMPRDPTKPVDYVLSDIHDPGNLFTHFIYYENNK